MGYSQTGTYVCISIAIIYMYVHTYVRGMIKIISFRLKEEHCILHTEDNNNNCQQVLSQVHEICQEVGTFQKVQKVLEVHFKI